MKRIISVVLTVLLLNSMCIAYAGCDNYVSAYPIGKVTPKGDRYAIDVDDFVERMEYCYSALCKYYFPTSSEYKITVEKINNNSYPVVYTIQLESENSDSAQLGYIEFRSSGYDDEDRDGKEGDVDNVKYVYPIYGQGDKTDSYIFLVVCSGIMYSFDEEYYNSAENKDKLNEIESSILDLFNIDIDSLSGFEAEDFELGDYKLFVSVRGKDENNIAHYVLEGGHKDLLFGMFLSREKIRKIAGTL